MEIFTVIKEFVNEKGYTKDEHCEGIVFYGSRRTGFSNAQSDIDLQILFDEHPLMRGVSRFKGYRFEFFEKTLEDMYNRALTDYNNQSNVMVSMIKDGITIYDKRGELERLKQYVEELYSKPLPAMTEQDLNEQIVILDNRLMDLKKLCLRDDIYFDRLYNLTIEKIRTLYYKKNAYPEISTSKVWELYNNPEYSKAISKILPPEYFIDLFERSLNPNLTKLEKYSIAEEMFNLVKEGNTLDLDDFVIPIKSRNKKK